MKKGLLSLLAVALTVVSCQNYDDQFQSLTDQITELSGTVQGLTALEGQLAALQQTVNGLATSQALAALAGVVTTNGAAITANGAAIAANGVAAATAADAAAAAAADAAAAATANAATAATAADAAAAAAATNAATAAAAADAAAAAAAANAATAAAADAVAVATAAATTDAIADVAAAVASVQASLTAIETAIGLVATTADLMSVSSTLAQVAEDVKEILAGDATINQDITITNLATLEYAETLVGTEVTDPNVIVNGQVRINMTNITATADIARVNAVASKFATILGDGTPGSAKLGLDVTSDTALTFTNLTFIDDDYTVSGSKQNDAALVTVSGDLTLNYGDVTDAISFASLTSARDIDISTATASSTLSVNFDGVDAENLTVGGGATLAFKAATTINLGGLEFTDLDADVATSVVAGATALTANTTVDAPLAETVTLGGLLTMTTFDLTVTADAASTISIGAAGLVATTGDLVVNADNAGDINSTLEDIDGAITITASSVTEVDFSDLETANGAITVNAQKVAKVDLSSLEATGNTIDIDATEIDFTALESIVDATDLNTVAILTTPALTSIAEALTVDNGPLNFPNARVSGSGDLISVNATKTTIASSDDADLDKVVSAETDVLVVTSQGIAVVLDATTAAVQHLSVTASDTAATYDLTVNTASSAALTHLDVSGFDETTVTAAAVLVTMTTAGTMRSLVVDNNDALVSLDINHTYDSAYTDAQLVDVTGNLILEAVDLTSVARLEDANITGNAALATIIAPGTSDPLTPGATTSILVSANALTATWTAAQPAVSNGITNTAYVNASVEQSSLFSWKTYITAIASSTGAAITFALDYDLDGAGVANTFSDDLTADAANLDNTPAFAVDINTTAELAIVTE